MNFHVIAFILLAYTGVAQEREVRSPDSRFNHFEDSLNKSKIGKPLSLRGRYSAIDGKTIDFDNLKHNVYLLFGEVGCAPCGKQLDDIVKISKEYTKIYYIYVYMGSEKSLREQLEDINAVNIFLDTNFFIINVMNDDELRRKKILFCYPTQYCIDRKKIIKSFNIGYKSKKFLTTDIICQIDY